MRKIYQKLIELFFCCFFGIFISFSCPPILEILGTVIVILLLFIFFILPRLVYVIGNFENIFLYRNKKFLELDKGDMYEVRSRSGQFALLKNSRMEEVLVSDYETYANMIPTGAHLTLRSVSPLQVDYVCKLRHDTINLHA